jgi:ferricrocin synthase
LGDFNIQRAPFAAVLEHVSAQDIDKSRRFFENYLKDLPTPPELPHVVDSQNYKTIEIEHSGYLSAAAASARSFNVSLHTLAQSAFAIALGEVYNHDDLVCSVYFYILSGLN